MLKCDGKDGLASSNLLIFTIQLIRSIYRLDRRCIAGLMRLTFFIRVIEIVRNFSLYRCLCILPHRGVEL